MLDFVNFTQGEIQFFGTNVNDLIEKYVKENDNLLGKTLKNIQVPDKCDKNSIESPYFSEKGKNLLLEFINSLSKLNSSTQKEFIESFKNKIVQEVQFTNLEVTSKGDIYKKLSPFVGLGIAIIIL